MTRSTPLLLGALCLVSVVCTPVSAADTSTWPQWRGPDRTGHVGGSRWPDSLEGKLEARWTQKLGPSYSGPIVGPERVYVTETVDEEREVVVAFDRETGEERWRASWKGAMSVPFFARENGSWIRSTPALDGDRLYVGGIRDVLVALDVETGEVAWRVDFSEVCHTPTPSFGMVCSPLVVGDALYVQAGGACLKMDKATGKILWQSMEDGGGMNSAFSSPLHTEISGVEQVLFQTRQRLAALSPESGETLWKIDVPAFRGMNIVTPVAHGSKVFTTSYGGGSFGYEVSRGENSKLSVAQVFDNSAQGYMSTPVLIGDHYYFHLRNQRFTCVDARTGERPWTTSRRFGKYMSLVAQGDRILALDEDGTLYLMRATPEELEILDSVEVASTSSWAHLAVSGNELWIRDLGGLTCHVWSSSKKDL